MSSLPSVRKEGLSETNRRHAAEAVAFLEKDHDVAVRNRPAAETHPGGLLLAAQHRGGEPPGVDDPPGGQLHLAGGAAAPPAGIGIPEPGPHDSVEDRLARMSGEADAVGEDRHPVHRQVRKQMRLLCPTPRSASDLSAWG